MERLNWHLADELSRVADVQVIAPKGSKALRPPRVDMIEVPLKPLGTFLIAATLSAVRAVRTWRPDIVLAGSGLTAFPVWIAACFGDARTAAYVHGLDLAVDHPLYRLFWRPALRRMQCVIANSRASADRARQLGIKESAIALVHPGVDYAATVPSQAQVEAFRHKAGLEGQRILLSVGRLSARKGLCQFVTHALPAIVERHPSSVLLVVGDAPHDALRAKAQPPEAIRAAARAAGVESNVQFMGVVTDPQCLATIYRCADVHVFPVRELPGDPEGFGMVSVEAASFGLPTVAFATGGVGDAVRDGVSGRLVRPGDYEAFAERVSELLAESVEIRTTAREFASEFAWPAFGRKVIEALVLSQGAE
ncbi:glycosyltransferase family 4 protein [Oleiagrimonas sp. C23AA]|uniref:glycosyltransferase family 4 protein n=1 Tax=Oleiagrimonas sp. C23AA TaxID=2719047 RepID=UPI001F0E0803|nr:glycosyltransferase family 4 protein [Oleiagrimonas sp. C23AA]